MSWFPSSRLPIWGSSFNFSRLSSAATGGSSLVFRLECCQHSASELFSPPECAGNMMSTGVAQTLVMPRLDMRGGQETDHYHSSGSACFDSGRAVLDDDAKRGIGTNCDQLD